VVLPNIHRLRIMRAMSEKTQKSAKPIIPLHVYLAEIGDWEEAGRILGVSARCAKGWRYRERRPRAQDIPRLIRRAGGALTFESFFEEEPEDDAATGAVE